jgi:hypothetical protein
MKAVGLLFGVLMMAVSSGCATIAGGDNTCDRSCLVEMTQAYLKAVGDRAPDSANLAADARITENGKAVTRASSVLSSARPFRYQQVFADAQSGQTSAFGSYEDDTGPVLYAVRLKMVKQQIVEVEAMVNRKGAHPFFAPQALTGSRAIFDAVVPVERRLSRERLQAVANSYLDAIEQHSSDVAPFHADCMRIENGIRTTDNPQANLPRSCKSGMQMFTYIPVVRDRSYPVVDAERGVVFAWGVFDMPGKATSAVVDGKTIELPARVREPKSMALAEVFKVVDGQIHTIEAFIRYEPLGLQRGWPH